jgi:hypothetical protein
MIKSNRTLQEISQRRYKKQKWKVKKINSLRKNILSRPTLKLPAIPFKVMNSQYLYFYCGFESALL